MNDAACLVQEEFEHGGKLCTQILSEGTPTKWHKLLEPVPFFRNYRNYLQARHSPCLHSRPLCSPPVQGTHTYQAFSLPTLCPSSSKAHILAGGEIV